MSKEGGQEGQKYEKTFTFLHEFGINTDERCETKITIEQNISNSTSVYNITYVHTIFDSNGSKEINSIADMKKPCPFAYFSKGVCESYDGAIVIKNDMTTAMIKFLMMGDDELSQHTGTTTPQQYRKLIMVNITQFWD